jgi:transglutaminase-like putative cysteine protease
MTNRRPAFGSLPGGWVAVILLYFMALAVAWAIDDAVWFLGDESITDFLQAAAIGGVTVSVVAVLVRWGRWTGHLIGAIFAALLIPIWVGERMSPSGTLPHELYEATAAGILDAVLQLIREGRVTSSQFGPTLLIYGILVWGTAQFAAAAVFRHRRPLPAIVSLGVLLIVNMAATPIDEVRYLVLFSGASLLLLVRLHALDEQTSWLRARLGDPGPVRSHTLRAGTAFVVAALAGSFVLTQTAVSAPLASSWPADLEDGLVDVGQELAPFFPWVTNLKGPTDTDFSVNPTIANVWEAQEGVAFTAQLPADAPPDLYWRAATYDRFSGRTWQPASEGTVPVAAGGNVLELIADPMVAPARRDVMAVITPSGRDSVAAVPGLPFRFDQPVDLGTHERTGSLVRVYLSQRGSPYQVEAATLTKWSAANPAGVSGNKLAALGDLYATAPAIYSQYTQLPETGVLGPVSRQFLAQVREAGGDNPYRVAAEMERRFREEFTYLDDVSQVECGQDGFVECFVRTKVGYCMYFATAMVELLREAQIPARLVMGYLPGERTAAGAGMVIETVNKSQAHAWVEVFFPGWGWIAFDPTTSRGVESGIPSGPAVAPTAPGASAEIPVGDDKFLERLGRGGGPPVEAGTDVGVGIGPVVVAAIGLALVAAAAIVAAAWIGRRRRTDIGVAEAYRRMVAMASRLGYGPRPSQTVYEYAEAIGNLVPTARVDLMTVATARVETTYARRSLGQDRLVAVADAARRLRISLLRLFFRRGGSRGPRPTRR